MTPTWAQDFRAAPGETHWVRLGSPGAADRLLPETTYQYTIYLDGEPKAGGVVRTGPTLDNRTAAGA